MLHGRFRQRMTAGKRQFSRNLATTTAQANPSATAANGGGVLSGHCAPRCSDAAARKVCMSAHFGYVD